MDLQVMDSAEEVGERAARMVLDAVLARPATVLGLPTGRTPVTMYRYLVSVCSDTPACFADVTTFNLDEYVGLPPDHPASFHAYMQRHLFAQLAVPPRRRHVPDGTARTVRNAFPEISVDQALRLECQRYEQALAAAGGLDLAILGLGRNGHIAFNEPGSPFDSRTRVVDLDESTRQANAADFAPGEQVPARALTMGIGTIREARRILLLASGEGKAEALARLFSGRVEEGFPASALWRHPAVVVLADRAAGAAIGPAARHGALRG